IELLNARDTLASTVTTDPTGTARLNSTWFTDAVTTIRLLCLLAAILAARSILASNSPPNKLFNGLVSLGRTKSVIIVLDCSGVFMDIMDLHLFNRRTKVKPFWILNGF